MTYLESTQNCGSCRVHTVMVTSGICGRITPWSGFSQTVHTSSVQIPDQSTQAEPKFRLAIKACPKIPKLGPRSALHAEINTQFQTRARIQELKRHPKSELFIANAVTKIYTTRSVALDTSNSKTSPHTRSVGCTCRS